MIDDDKSPENAVAMLGLGVAFLAIGKQYVTKGVRTLGGIEGARRAVSGMVGIGTLDLIPERQLERGEDDASGD